MRFLRNIIIVVAVGSIAACGPVGSGDIVSEERGVGVFESVQVSGGIDMTLIVDEMSQASVTVVYDDNLLDRIVTEVEGSTLVIRSRGSHSVLGAGRHVEVTTNVLQELSASGGSDVMGSGLLDSLVVDASGGSDIDLSDLVVRAMVLDVTGGSDATVNVTGEVEGAASGGAEVTILGDPAAQRIDVSSGADVGNE